MPRPWVRSTVAAAAVTSLCLGPLTLESSGVAAAAVARPGSPSSSDSLFPHSGNGGYDVRHYDIALRFQRPRIHATTTVSAVARRNLSAFFLDLEGLVVDRVTVNGKPAPFSRSGHELRITPTHPVGRGRHFSTVVTYHGLPQFHIDPDGVRDGWVNTPDGETVVAEPVGAMTWFPCNNTLADKATYRFTVRAPKRLTVAANGLPVRTVEHPRSTTSHWRETDQMSTYLAAISIGKYDVIRDRTNHGTRVISFLDPSEGGYRSAAKVPGIVDYLEKRFGRYPLTSAGIIVDNVPVSYALEVQTRPVFPDPPSETTLVHELVHQWFGDSVTPKDWGDVWLNEGFATYGEWLWVGRDKPGAPRRIFDRKYQRLDAGRQLWHVPPADLGRPKYLFSNSVYTRGAMALEAFRLKMGDKAFFALLHRWPTRHYQANASTHQLKRMAERLSGRQLDHLFKVWLYTPHKPRGY
ncbi:MAG: M1 family metallopeptidase [Nocardioidaceae bacterium]